MKTYTNPVYPGSCPDPFILKHQGEYWCYSTALASDGRLFNVLHSSDLVAWREVGGALVPLEDNHPYYWAPEVMYDNGLFYLYYSVGNEELMQIRVAVSASPDGPFKDSGHRLTREDFAIDAHVFEDEDGTRYLFYATDFLDHTHVGTGTVMDRMVSPYTLEGRPRPVSRARYDWQVYDPVRVEKGGVRWHTVEGPFVLKRKGRYYQMFSGGNWKNITYGVSYATSQEIERDGEWDQICDGERVLPILRTIPAIGVTGPGHNSVIRGPDNLQLYCVYHRWVQDRSGIDQRTLALDRMDWAGPRLEVLGPTTSPQPAPNMPVVRCFLPSEKQAGKTEWQFPSGSWDYSNGGPLIGLADPGQTGEAVLTLPATSFVLEFTLQAFPSSESTGGSMGFSLQGNSGNLFSASFRQRPGPEGGVDLQVTTWEGETRHSAFLDLQPSFNPLAAHLLRLEVNEKKALLCLDNGFPCWRDDLRGTPVQLTLFTRGLQATFSGLELTAGWQDDFQEPAGNPLELGWYEKESIPDWNILNSELKLCGWNGKESTIMKALPGRDYELILNLRLDSVSEEGGTFGIYPALDQDGRGPLLQFVQKNDKCWRLISGEDGGSDFQLPEEFDPFVHQQLRFRKQAGVVEFSWQNMSLGSIQAPVEAVFMGLHVRRSCMSLDMVRAVLI